MNKPISTLTLDENQVHTTLEDVTLLENKLSLPYEVMRKCVARLYSHGLYKGSYPDRNTGALIIATELRRVDKCKEEVLFLLKDWNQKNNPSLKISQLEKAVKSAFQKKDKGDYRYKYTCNNSYLMVNCVGKEYCRFGRSFKKHRKYNNNRLFLDYGWQNILSNKAKDIYYIAIPELERRLVGKAGAEIFAAQRKIAHFAGVERKDLSKYLLELKRIGLLTKCIVGVPGVRGKATVIQRKIPIPRPSRELIEGGKKYSKGV